MGCTFNLEAIQHTWYFCYVFDFLLLSIPLSLAKTFLSKILRCDHPLTLGCTILRNKGQEKDKGQAGVGHCIKKCGYLGPRNNGWDKLRWSIALWDLATEGMRNNVWDKLGWDIALRGVATDGQRNNDEIGWGIALRGVASVGLRNIGWDKLWLQKG